MKNKTSQFVATLLLASSLLSVAQTDVVKETNAAPAAPETPATAAAPAAPAAPEAAVAPAAPTTLAAPVEAPAPVATADTNATVSADGANDVVPLIQIDDAELPNAINTLARQAGINFQFDPKILNPAPDATGKIPAPPKVSFRWENVTAMEALLALLENYNLQIVRDPKTKIARITQKDAAALEPLMTHVFQLNYANPTNLVTILTNTISPRGRVVADIRTSQLVISATEKELDAVESLITKLDTQTKQILIEARFLEINKNPRTSKGLDWTETLGKQNITFGNGITTSSSSTRANPPTTDPAGNPVPGRGSSTTTLIDSALGSDLPGFTANTASGVNPSTFFLNADGVKVALSFLNSDADLESIATPRAVTLENVPTELNVVRNIPVFEEQQGANTGGSVQANTVKPNYLLVGPGNTILNEVGIKLMVTPRIFGTSNVFLDLHPEISEKEVEPESTVLGGRLSTAPIFSRRKLQTQAMIPSGYTLVLGGLRQDFNSKTYTKVPFLGDLPGIGLAFRSHKKARDQRDLVIFVTPTIIRNDDFQLHTNSAAFLKRKMEDKPTEEWTPWDSGKPADWTKPDNSIKPRYAPKQASQ